MVLNRKGFTLVEVMVVVSLMGILLISVQGILRFSLVENSDFTNYYKQKIEARYAMNKVIHEIKTNVGATFDSGNKQVMASDGTTILINATPTDTTEDGNIFFYYEPDRYGIGDGYGELRGQDGRIIAKHIKDFQIQTDDVIDPTHKLLKVTVKSGKEDAGRTFQFSTYVQLY